jgi:hypothetical protein
MLKMQQQEELNLKKEQTSHSDLLDALRLALKVTKLNKKSFNKKRVL